MPAGVRIRDRDRGYRKLLATAASLNKGAKVTVGIHAKEGDADHGEATISYIASIHEFGAGDIPSRSFIRAWFDEELDRNKQILRDLHVQVLAGKITEEVALERFGLYAVGRIQARIAAGIAPPNAPSTIARKGSSTPLIDKGQLRSSVTHVVETP